MSIALWKNAAKKPQVPFAELLFPGQKIKSTSITEAIAGYREKNDEPWRDNKIRQVGTLLRGVQKMPMALLTWEVLLQEFRKMFPKKSLTLLDQRSFKASIRNLLDFVHNGEIALRERGPYTKPSGDLKITTQEIDESEALALVDNSRGKNAEFRLELATALKNLPQRKSHLFSPKLSQDETERTKEVAALKSACQKCLCENKLSFSINYIASKNLFVLIRKSTQPKEKK